MMKNVLEYLEASAERHPKKIAFADEQHVCTYEELLARSRRIGTGLAEKFSAGQPVPVFMEKSTDTIAVFMGAVCAGCFYVVLDIRQPAARLRQILGTLEADRVVSLGLYKKELEKLPEGMEVVWAEELDRAKPDPELLKKIRERALDTDPLYGIFTSGSTGIPKGVLVSHRSVIDFIDHFTKLFDIGCEDVIGNQAPWDFDVSVKDIYSGLKTGAQVQIIPKRMFSFPTQLLDFLCERQVTTLIWAVSALCLVTALQGFTYRVPDKVRKVLFSGETMPIKHLRAWREALPGASFVNLYGPTEITCNCTYYRVEREFEPGDALPVGRPFPNEKVFLLDGEDREVTEPRVKGEICVAGTALALGYYNDPEQTRKAFTQNPLNPRYPERIYRTGDLGYYGEDGLLYFSSRKDFQIKHMGHRIELGEIEAALESLEGVERACCVFHQEKNRIAAFYQGNGEKRELKKQLGAILPMFMLPGQMIPIESFPLTKNGKIDRGRLYEEYLEVVR